MSDALALSSRPLRLMLIDDDSVFRLGLRFGLSAFPDIQITAEAADGEAALQALESRFAGIADRVQIEVIDLPSPNPNLTPGIDLVLLDIGLGRNNPAQIQGLMLCQQMKTQYPNIPILLLSATADPLLLAAAQQSGANGFCLKSVEVSELINAIRRTASGQPFFQPPALAAVSPRPPQPPSPLALLRQNWRRSGNRQIDRTMTDITNALQDPNLSPLDRTILSGRYRELRAARWLLNRLLAPAIPPEDTRSPAAPVSSSLRPTPSPSNPPPSSLISYPPTPISQPPISDLQNIQSIVFDAVFAKLQTSLENQTAIPLEIDILREGKKRELIYLILRKFEDLMAELRYSQVSLDLLAQKRSSLLVDLWQATVADFFGRYATLEVNGTAIEIVDVLLQDAVIVQLAILDKIPGFTDLLAHLLFQNPLLVDSVPCASGNPAALERAEVLLENLVIQVANAVIQPLLNRFANVEAIKQNFYDRRLLSSREVERFRNDLSWKYRVERYFNEPKDIFESHYRLLTLFGRGIKQMTIYAPRNQELAELSGIPLVVTIALETRDAVAPRLRSTVAFLGNGVIYVLTNVIGRGIGLIGRGIIEGIGNVFQDERFSRK